MADNVFDDNVVSLKAAKAAQDKAPKCPLCAKPTAPEYTPFCSKRCADIDLGRWLGDGYRIASQDPADSAEGADGDFDDEEL